MSVKSKIRILECLAIAFLFFVPGSIISAVAVDTDGDTWDDLYETYIGTDPENPDTDGDYIPDNEDPTPKGGLLNEDEIWDVFLVDITPSAVLVDEGTTIKLNISAEELLPHGTRVPVDNEVGNLKVYWGSYYGNLELVWKQSVTLSNGISSSNFTPDDAGIYYFVLVMGDDTLGSQTSKYEIDWLESKGKGGYCYVTVYPHFYATVSEKYRNLLPGMTGAFDISFYEFSPAPSVNLSHYTGTVSISQKVLEDLYVLSSGSVQVQVSLYGGSSSNTVQVNDELVWEHEFSEAGSYSITVYSFNTNFSWDYTFSAKFTFSRCYVTVHDPEVTWYTIDNAELFQVVGLTVHRYILDAESMGASAFNDRYIECRSIRGIIERYPANANPWTGTAFLYALYTVYDHSARQTAATIISENSINVLGNGTLSFPITTPGGYQFTCSFGTEADYPTTTKFYLTYYNSYSVDDTTYFYVNSPLALNVWSLKTEAFVGESIETYFKVNDPDDLYDIQAYLDGSKNSLLTPVAGSADVTLSTLSKGEHQLKGAVIFNPETTSLLDLFGIENFYGDWLAETSIRIFVLAIIANPPSTLVSGIETQFRVIVQQGRNTPASSADITVTLTTSNSGQMIVFNGKCDSDGSIIVSFMPPSKSFNQMEITASTGSLTETITTSIYLRDQSYEGLITLNKPLYHPNDMIMARFLVFNKDKMTPADGQAEIRLRDPYRRDIYRETVLLNEYGGGNIDIPIGQKAPWGRYRIQVYYNDLQVGSVDFDVKEYTTPEVKITLFEGEAVQGENITISAYVEYLFGQAVREGKVNFTVEFQNQVPYYYRWYWYDMDGIPDMYSQPYESYRTDRTIDTSVNVTDGWANITLYVPYNATRIFVTAEFYDDLEHEAADEKAYYVGAAPLEGAQTTLTITSSKTQWAVDDVPDLSISLGYEKAGTYYQLPETDFSLRLTAKDLQNTALSPRWYNGTTDTNGTWHGSILNFDIDTRTLLERDYYWLEFGAFAEAVEGGDAQAELSMPIYRYIHRVSTEDVYFARDDTVNIMLEQYDLLNDTGVPGEAVVEIKPYNSYYNGHYYQTYGSELLFSKTFNIDQTGKLKFTWTVPLGLLPGLFNIEVDYENATVSHIIQVIDHESNVLSLSTPQSYKADSNFTVTGEFSKTYIGKIFIDAYSGDLAQFTSMVIEGKEISEDIGGFNTRAMADIHVHYLDNGLYRSQWVSISPEIPELKLLLAPEKTDYEPGELLNLTVTILEDGKISTNNFLLGLVISDQGVYELVEDTMRDTIQLSSYLNPSWLNRGHHLSKNLREVLYIKQEGLAFSSEVRRIIRGPSSYYDDGSGNWSDEYDRDSDNDITMGGSPKSGGVNFAGDESGDSLESELESTDVREFFTETAYFEPGLVMNGKSVISIKLPDNIGRWRIKALASSLDLLGCFGISTFNVSKDFFIDLKLPSPLRQDDQTTITIRAYNFAGKPITATLGIKKAEGWLQILDAPERTVTLADGEVRDVKFIVNILGYDWQSLTAIGSDFAGHTDALTRSVYIRPNGALKVIHEAGAVDENSKEITFSFDPDILNGSEKVTLRLSPGYSGLLMDGAGALASYSYGCTEQTMSALLPNILLWEYLDESGKLTREIRYWLGHEILEGVQQLYSYQHGDGGWGWWKADASDPWMTSYVLYGLARADKTGFYVDPSTIAGAQQYLGSVMDENGRIPASAWMGNDSTIATAYAAYALAYSSSSNVDAVLKALDSDHEAGKIQDPYVLAFYALALNVNGDDSSDIIKTLVSKRTGSHWESTAALGGNDEATGWCTYALATTGYDKYKAEIRGALEYLSALRRPWGGWATTSDTISAMHAILAVVKNSEPVNMDVTVSANGEVVKKVHVDESYTAKQNFHSAMDAIDLTGNVDRSKKNTVKISLSGTGDLFYELTAVEYLRTEAVISIPAKLNGTELEDSVLEVKVDPKNSEAVNMVDVEIIVPDSDEVSVLYVEEVKPELEDDVWRFKVYLMPLTHGNITISPIIVSYRLTAGFGESGVIRRYFGPVTLEAERSKTGSGTPGSYIENLKVKKSVSENIGEIGESVQVKIELLGELNQSVGSYMVDQIPSAFELVGSHGGGEDVNQAIFYLDGSDNFTYTMKLNKDFRGQLPPVKLKSSDETTLATSNIVEFTSSQNNITVARTYSRSSAAVGETIEVNISAHSEETVYYAVVEDLLPPSCNFVTTTLDAVKGSEPEIMDYTISGNKVAFFVRSLNDISFTYKFTVSDVVLAPIEPARAYGMYDPDNIAMSNAKLFMSYENSMEELNISGYHPDDDTGGDGPVIPTDEDDEQDKDKDQSGANPIQTFQLLAVLIPIAVIISILAVRKRNKDKATRSKTQKTETEKPIKAENKPGQT